VNTEPVPLPFLQKLIQAGKQDDETPLGEWITPQEQALHGGILRKGMGPWRQVADSLGTEDLVALIKCLSRAEQAFPGWGAGSVSPVIVLYNRLCLLDGRRARQVADWVLSNTDNPYLPFGTHNLGAKSVDEYHRLAGLALERKTAGQRAEAERQELARQQKAAKATRALYGAVKRGDVQAVKALLVKGADSEAKDPEGVTIKELTERQSRRISSS
jgi:hypothetical protein